MARRDDREYREYLSEEQRSQRGPQRGSSLRSLRILPLKVGIGSLTRALKEVFLCDLRVLCGETSEYVT